MKKIAVFSDIHGKLVETASAVSNNKEVRE